MFNLSDDKWGTSQMNWSEVMELWSFLNQHITCRKHIKIGFSDASGIGTNAVVECLCGAQKDFTDYEAW